MMVITLLVGVFTAAAVIGLVWWKSRSGFDATQQTQGSVRRREDARDWQRKFSAESPLNTSFFPPTQNEILETLSILDHLIPRWETGEAAVVESLLLNELALNFPTLRKPGCAFPDARIDRPATADLAARREAFRAQRAQLNALDQIVSSPVGPGETAPDDVSPGRPDTRAARAVGVSWPVLLGGAAVLVAGVLGALRFYPQAFNFKTTVPPVTLAAPLATSPVGVALPEPSPAVAAVAESAPVSSPTPAAQAADLPPRPAPVATPSQAALAFQRQIAASKQRAVAQYPALAVEGSEINLRFVFRYKNLVQENSPRLLDPNWPEQLVDECAAAAAGTAAKRDGFTRVLGTPR